MTAQPVNPNIAPGLYTGIPNEAYHAGPGISKSGIWTIATQSPAHYKYGESKASKAFDFGEAVHLAVLQPNEFEQKVYRGPEDRRGNKWKDVAEHCEMNGLLLLTSGDYDKSLLVRDSVHADAWLNAIITGGNPVVEASGYWHDEETGVLCRCRPDLYREDLGIVLDVKSTVSAHPDAFARSVVNYGYHGQEAHYSTGLRSIGKQVDGFVFLALEKETPFCKAVYELPPSIVDEGAAVIRKGLNTYAECLESDTWPAYPAGIQELAFQRWAYRETEFVGEDQ